MWVSREVIEDDMPHPLDAVPTIEVKPFSVQQKVALPLKEKAASFGHFAVLLERQNVFVIFLSETVNFKTIEIGQQAILLLVKRFTRQGENLAV